MHRSWCNPGMDGMCRGHIVDRVLCAECHICPLYMPPPMRIAREKELDVITKDLYDIDEVLFYDPEENIFMDEDGEIVLDVSYRIGDDNRLLFRHKMCDMVVKAPSGSYVGLVYPENLYQ